MPTDRAPQLTYSESQPAMLDEARRREKAAKLITVLCHFLGRADRYYERFRGRRGMRAMLPGFEVWDYTFSVMAEPDRFRSHGDMPGPVAKLPMRALKTLRPILPTFLWVATKSVSGPKGPQLIEPPRRV